VRAVDWVLFVSPFAATALFLTCAVLLIALWHNKAVNQRLEATNDRLLDQLTEAEETVADYRLMWTPEDAALNRGEEQ
jgi:hypothetical protein